MTDLNLLATKQLKAFNPGVASDEMAAAQQVAILLLSDPDPVTGYGGGLATAAVQGLLGADAVAATRIGAAMFRAKQAINRGPDGIVIDSISLDQMTRSGRQLLLRISLVRFVAPLNVTFDLVVPPA